MKRPLFKIILLLAILLPLFSQAQKQTYKITGRVSDLETGEPLSYVTVKVRGMMIGKMTDENGKFVLELGSPEAILEVSMLGYQPIRYKVKEYSTRLHEIKLKTQDITLDEVLITDGLQRVLEDKTIYLYDYEYWGEDLFLIIYDRKLKRSKLALLNQNDSIVATDLGVEIPGKFKKDCFGNVYAIGSEWACQVFTLDGEIGLYKDSLALFERVVEPCIGHLSGFFYYQYYRFNRQILDYYTYNPDFEDGEFFDQTTDRVRMHQLLDPHPDNIYNAIANSEEGFLDISNDTWEEVAKLNVEFQFQQLVFFCPIYAPLRVIGNEIFVFDHLNKEARVFNAGGIIQRKFPIHYQERPYWDKFIVVDEARDEAYTTFTRNGNVTLGEIDLESGQILSTYELPRQFPKKVRVRDGVVHFMYQELNYDDTNRLYRLRIKD